MKLKTAIISVVVSAALVAGAGYGAYYAMQGKKSPVEVVPVSNVNTGYWGGSESFFGSVTSKVAQTVQLNEEYSIDQIFVKEGDEVTEGAPLFSYDMTLQELEYEMEELTLQTQGLTLTKLEKDLEKLKGTRVIASLEGHSSVMTASSGEPLLLDEPSGDEETEAADGRDGMKNAENQTDSMQPAAGNGAEVPKTDTKGGQSSPGGLKIEGMEVVKPTGEQAEALTLVDSVVSYEHLVLAIDALFRMYEDELRADEVGTAIEEAVVYYRKHLANEKITQEQLADGTAIEVKFYVLKDELGKVLNTEEIQRLQTISEKLDEYQTRYVDMLILETSLIDPADVTGFLEAMKQIRKSYDLLATRQQMSIENGEIWQELKEREQTLPAEDTKPEEDGSQEEQSETGSETEPETMQETEQGGLLGESESSGENDVLPGESESSGENDVLPGESEGSGENDVLPGESEGSGENDVLPENPQETEGVSEAQSEYEAWTEVVSPEETETLITEALEESTYGAEIPEEKEKHTLTIYDPAKGTEPNILEYETGELVIVLKAAEDDPTRTFVRWEVTDPALSELQNWEQPDWANPSPTFYMPPVNLTVSAVYLNNIDEIGNLVDAFVSMADLLLQDGAKEALTAQGKDFATELGTAVSFYQQWLCCNPVDILDTPYDEADMSKYQMLENVDQYLKDTYPDRDRTQELKDSYKELSIRYARALFDKLNPNDLVRADLDLAGRIYGILGEEWRLELEARWQEEQLQKIEQDGIPGPMGPGGEDGEPGDSGDLGDPEDPGEDESEGLDSDPGSMTPATPASIGDLLAVYHVYILFQDYQKMDPDASEDSKFTALQAVARQCDTLTEEQKMLVMQQNPELVATLQQYGLWKDTAIPEPDPGDDWGDFGDFGDEGYTAGELREMIEDKEHEIKTCRLDIRETELSLKSRKRVLDGKIVKSTLNGTVVSIGTEDGESDDDYFVKVTNQTGLYAKGSMNELALEKIHVGDTISGMMTSTGVSFTAEIMEISEYPDPNGGNMSFGTENTNASYYPFYAKINEVEDIEEGEAEIQLSGTLSTSSNGIYLEKYFIRTENDGRSYVYMQGPDGKLKKQYIQTGKTIYSYAIEVLSGLELTDRIAFPYGKNVVEGAETKEVDALQEAYM